MRGLFVRLTVSHLLVGLGGLIILFLLSPSLFSHVYLRAEKQRLQQAAGGLAGAARRLARDPATRPDLEFLVRTSAGVIGGQVTLVLNVARGELVASDPGAGAREVALQQARLAPRATGVIDVSLLPPDSLAARVSVPLTETTGVLVIVRRVTGLPLVLQAQRLITTISAGLAALLAIALALLFARQIATPLVTMSRAAKQVAAGNFDLALPPRGPTEIRALATSFNRMAQHLSTAFSDLADERQRLMDLLASMAEGVIGLNRAGKITLINQAARQLLQGDWQPGQPLAAVGTGEWVKAVVEIAAGAPASHAVYSAGERILSVSAAPLQQGGAVVVLADVTEAQQLQQLRRDFVANASHELRAPLASIRGFIGAVLDGTAAEPERIQTCLQAAADEAMRMTRIVEELLQLSRLQAGVLPFEWQPTDLVAVVTGMVQAAEPKRLAQGVQVRLEAGALPLIEADGDRLAQVVVNLLDNGLRYSPEGGLLKVRVELADEQVVVVVADQGPGIPATDLPTIFERFHKADPARSRLDPGAGLGLAIAREIIRTHGGDMLARNRPGGGAEVGFWLPLTRPEPLE